MPTGASLGVNSITLPRSRALRVGRDPDADIFLFDRRISRNHAQFGYDETRHQYTVSDLGSANGVTVNGQRIAGATLLNNGDKIEIGNWGEITFDFVAQPIAGLVLANR